MALQIYKRGQGYYTRLLSALGAGVIVALGCWRLYEKLGGLNVSPNKAILIQTLVPVGVFVVLSFLVFWLVNKPSMANFMIAAEGEVKKVSWSSKKEISISTFIVIIVVICMATLLACTDFFFQIVFRIIGLLPALGD